MNNHQGKYMIINLSEKEYDANISEMFQNQFIHIDNWPDNYAPTISILFDACNFMDSFLKADDENVIVVHCKHGRGRTGLLICCYLLYS